MTYEGDNRGIRGSLVFIICFIIACLFLYWAVQYWVYNNFDKGRYEIVKIQSTGGSDSWSFWKLDRRTGQAEYCSLDMSAGARLPDFTCLRADTIKSRDEDPLRANAPMNTAPATAYEPATSAASSNSGQLEGITTTTTAPAMEATPATPAQ